MAPLCKVVLGSCPPLHHAGGVFPADMSLVPCVFSDAARAS